MARKKNNLQRGDADNTKLSSILPQSEGKTTDENIEYVDSEIQEENTQPGTTDINDSKNEDDQKENPQIESKESEDKGNNPKDETQPNNSDLGENKSNEGIYTDPENRKWGFTKRTPKKFRFNGVIKTQADWIKDDEAMEMLVYGNSTYVQQIKE
jgi:hypothetical protein